MFKLSKKVEYGLIAVKHIAEEGKINPCSAKEISEEYKIPYELLSKILQKLTREKILYSIQGIKGGYKLSKKPEKISLSSVMTAIEGNSYILDCGLHDDPGSCKIYSTCSINNPLQKIQKGISRFFNTTKVSEIV
ncbi:MAG: Rrf2 family transcriptional regulator [Ignavibacteria bacterium]|jgi:Rrf2 family protein